MAQVNIPATYPFPDTYGAIHAFDNEEYEAARLVWRASLSDADVRALATDYRMGRTTEENYDAYLEYYAREMGARDAAAKASKKPPKRSYRKNRG